MRPRLAIWILLPCLCLAWPAVPIVCAQVSGLLAPADPEASGVRRDVKTAAQARVAQPNAQPPTGAQPPTDAAAPATTRPAVPPDMSAGKWDDSHWVLRYKRPILAWPKLLLPLLLTLIWVMSADWVNRESQTFALGYGKWNPIIFFPFFIVLVVFAFPVLMPFSVNFCIAFGLLFV